ncbi:hypothetical protein TNCV_3243581 [Trichonephila clavipes]|nr:hypothetical protein TNCV_3243581 [Trichonephila clavipes]
MAGYQHLNEFEIGVVIGAREMGHSISEVAMTFGFFHVRPFHECNVNIGNTVKHQIYDIAEAGKDHARTGPTSTDEIIKMPG